jgi:hypothetical protein
MPTPLPSPPRCFMIDFASRDKRSAHAHLRGVSPRARAYTVFEFIEKCVGRHHAAANDFRCLATWAYQHRGAFLSFKARIAECAIATTGISAGAVLSYLLLS